jgi:ABC-type nitrate/sulfonate/bicarbonate transport system substrate-binding protein
MVYILGWKVIDMKGNGRRAWEMDMAQTSLPMGISTLVNIVKVYLKGMGNTNGKTGIFIVEILRKDWNMVKVNGDKNHPILMNLINSISLKEITYLMWKMGMDALLGKQEIDTLVILKMI